MARVLAITLLENCTDSSTVKEFRLDEPLSEHLMRAMALGGDLKYYAHFPRPYFRIERALHYVIQGVVGNHTFRVTFSPQANEDTESELCGAIQGAL